MFSYEEAWTRLKREIESIQSSAESPERKATCKEILKSMNEMEYLAVCRAIVRSSYVDDDD